jgi:hypothetical protein
MIGPWGHWFPTPRLALAAFRRSERFLPTTVPRSLAQTGSSSLTLYASSECCRPGAAPRLPAWSASLGVAIPLRDVSLGRRCHRVPTRQPSVLGVSHALDGFIRPRPCGFVSPHSHVQGSLFRVFPSRTAEPPRRRPVPSRRLARGRCRCCHRRHNPLPRPQGFDPCESPLSVRWGLAAALTRYPLELSLLQVLLLNAVGTPSRPFRSWPSERDCRSHPLS